MPETKDAPEPLPEATVVRRRRTRINIIWIIPILAAVVAIGIAVQRILSEGPLITITFRSAEGIEAGKSVIKYKDVNIGQVTAVQLTDDYSKVLVKARIAKHAAGLMVADAKFWIVSPRINLSGVSGLSTLLSGNYIGFEAGKSDESERNFTALDEPPFIAGQRGKRFILKSSTLGSLNVGAPVYYRQINVGQVAGYNLSTDGKTVEVTVFINAPYDRYVTRETRFWNASGIEVTMGADGFDVRTESLVALIAGGLAFDAPDYMSAAAPAPANTNFTIYRDRADAMKQPDPVERRYVLYFNESVRGLSVGAPVTLYGLTVGEVTEVGLTVDEKTLIFRPRVLITFYPERVVAALAAPQQGTAQKRLEAFTNPQARGQLIRRLVEERGLRGQLRTGSFLTGELYVAFEYYPNAPKVKLDPKSDPLELPVIPGGLANLEAKLSNILNKIDAMPLEAIGVEVRNAVIAANKALKDADTFISHVDVQWVPDGQKVLQDLHSAITNADKVIINTDATFFGANSPAPQDLRDALQEVTRAARSVRVLMDYLERHPEILIRGKAEEKK